MKSSYSLNLESFSIDARYHRHLTFGIAAAVIALSLTTAGYAVYQWYADWQLAHSELPAAPALSSTDKTRALVAAIPNEHIFGQAATGLGNMPISNLQLRVTGISKIEGDDEEAQSLSRAYISMAGQPSKIYKIGDNLPYGVKVYDITADTVVLENGGKLEKLPIPRDQLQFKPKPMLERS